MKTVVYYKYGPADELTIEDRPQPTPKKNEVIVKVYASSVNPVDWRLRKGEVKLLTGNNFPRYVGADIAGVVAETGANVSRFNKGDQVYGMISAFHGGALAEYASAKETELVLKPSSLDFKQAAAIPLTGLTSLQALRDKGQLQAGQNILINGASGGVGTMAVQLARIMGAHVTAVCSTPNHDLVKKLGAENVFDYKEDDILETDTPYDVLFDCVGKICFREARNILTQNGIHITTEPGAGNFWEQVKSWFRSQKYAVIMTKRSGKDLAYLRELIEEKKLTPVIDSVFRMEDAAKAHKHSESKHAAGKIVLEVMPS